MEQRRDGSQWPSQSTSTAGRSRYVPCFVRGAFCRRHSIRLPCSLGSSRWDGEPVHIKPTLTTAWHLPDERDCHQQSNPSKLPRWSRQRNLQSFAIKEFPRLPLHKCCGRCGVVTMRGFWQAVANRPLDGCRVSLTSTAQCFPSHFPSHFPGNDQLSCEAQRSRLHC